MATSHPSVQRVVPASKQQTPARPSQPSGPAIVNDGPESLRSSHC